MHEQRYNDIGGRGRRSRRRDRTLMVLRLVAAGLSLVLAVELLWALYRSPRLQVRQVRVVGVRMLDPAAVIASAAIPPGATLAGVSTRKLRRAIAAIPAVERATVARDWPATLVIVVRERTPAVFVRCRQGIVFVDRRGIAFTGTRCDTAGLPELKGVGVAPGEIGRALKGRAVAQALVALSAAQEAELPVSEVVLRGRDDLALRLADGTALHLGRPQQLRLKVSQAKVALIELRPRQRVEYIDVSCPDAAVWKPRLES
ncbi:MAG TPA: FtsQ-type POTRA domain-containing protein [Armatimonadota bacterium]|nr:FtsQ-type POTRA domain-containing protein [Armatimonadota bacterium]